MTTEYLTVKDAAKMFRVSNKTILRWIENGSLRGVRIAHTIRFDKQDLLMQLDKSQNGSFRRQHDPSLE